jgi:hypothetical protein
MPTFISQVHMSLYPVPLGAKQFLDSSPSFIRDEQARLLLRYLR